MRLPRLQVISLVLAVALLVSAGGIATTQHPAHVRTVTREGAQSRVIPRFAQPTQMILVGGRLWVCNDGGNYLSEVNASTGAVIRTAGGRADRLSDPSDITTNGRFLWVTNYGDNLITELSALDGSLMRVIHPAGIRFQNASAISYSDGYIWVAAGGNVNHSSEIVELSASSGAIVRVVKRDIWAPETIDAVGSQVWVGNLADVLDETTGNPNKSITELSARTGAVERVLNLSHVGAGVQAATIAPYGGSLWISNGSVEIPGTNYQAIEIHASTGHIIRLVGGAHPWSKAEFGGPSGVSILDNRVWISDSSNVVELDARTGKVIRIVGARRDRIDGTQDVVAYRGYVWISNSDGNSLTELRASDGALVRIVG